MWQDAPWNFVFQSHDQEEAVRGGGQPAAGGGQCAGTFPQVHGHPPDQAAFWEVIKIHTSSATRFRLPLSFFGGGGVFGCLTFPWALYRAARLEECLISTFRAWSQFWAEILHSSSAKLLKSGYGAGMELCLARHPVYADIHSHSTQM